MLQQNFFSLVCKILLIGNILLPVHTQCSAHDNLLVDSDRLIFEKDKNNAYFEGNVVVKFHDMILTTSYLQVLYKKNQEGKNQIDQIIIPVLLKVIKLNSDNVIIAKKAIYYFDRQKLVLNNVQLIRDNNLLKTDKLIYHTQFKNLKSK